MGWSDEGLEVRGRLPVLPPPQAPPLLRPWRLRALTHFPVFHHSQGWYHGEQLPVLRAAVLMWCACVNATRCCRIAVTAWRQVLFGPHAPAALAACPRYKDLAGDAIVSALGLMATLDDALVPLLQAAGRVEGRLSTPIDARLSLGGNAGESPTAADAEALLAVLQGCEGASYGPSGLNHLCSELQGRLSRVAACVLDRLPPTTVPVLSQEALRVALAPAGRPQAIFLFSDQRARHGDAGALPLPMERDVGALMAQAAAAAQRDAHNVTVTLSKLGAALGYVICDGSPARVRTMLPCESLERKASAACRRHGPFPVGSSPLVFSRFLMNLVKLTWRIQFTFRQLPLTG